MRQTPETNMYFPFYKSGISKVVDDGVPVSPNFPRQTNDTDECNESSVEVSSPKKQKMKGDRFELMQQKFRERNDIRKSPLPYIGMIAEAIDSSPDKKMVLSEIYTYMEQNFFQYLSGKPRWRNTVRHNLSFHKCFVKCECSRRGNRSHYWSIHPDYIEQFKRGNFTKTLSPPRDQVNVSPYAPEQQLFRRNSNENHHRFFPNSEYENYLHYDVLSPPNTNTLYQVIRPSTSAVLHPHCELRPFPLVQTSSLRGNSNLYFHLYASSTHQRKFNITHQDYN